MSTVFAQAGANKTVPNVFPILSMSQSVWGLVPPGIYEQHGGQEKRTIQPVSTLCSDCHSFLMLTDGGSHTGQDWVDACWNQTVGPPVGRAGSERRESTL